MQRVANCIYMKNGEILLLQKPRRGWWAIPGGKVEPKETVKAAAIREYGEETGIQIRDPIIKGIYTFLIEDDDKFTEWMMFTFFTNQGDGIQKNVTREGKLQWHPVDKLGELPMAEGDRLIIQQALFGENVQFGTFHYTKDFQLISQKLD
ncbi:8-oxo-dGTP diphosphatase [Caldifermentibacillus hisashii]|uniref:NUDIX hydrolase n=1 Tax=Bacillaceae TaxID=186817 RepID=UPI000D54D3B3|nr:MULTISPECIES: 8-oxo-dGTP diphosphatase [Bacillaceae]AWI13501.1 NUDIX hydrolase [Caldibacillus thermoamylovorans]MBU5342149.1 8-oxo-dGTP diphosphatase [Caldifermentibacillus hisashii]MCM3477763.1 8-oxo-dGTP diphosphatase [Caldibacillus thermoamylovorans]MCM3799101.1 8-oxo-dGTP diphosphatase [Caldibacillus thermoamylovorans]